ncbi:hypothetical protein HYU18_02170 [Candidatus Woesearchaeota archaeon]|nr:hypothetical protein [Candidatus Woesearchaeota archaeon]
MHSGLGAALLYTVPENRLILSWEGWPLTLAALYERHMGIMRRIQNGDNSCLELTVSSLGQKAASDGAVRVDLAINGSSIDLREAIAAYTTKAGIPQMVSGLAENPFNLSNTVRQEMTRVLQQFGFSLNTKALGLGYAVTRTD